MSKRIDLSKLGGFPGGQAALAYLQAAVIEQFAALSQNGGLAGPYSLYGFEVTATAGVGTLMNYSWTAGWIMYQNNLVKVPAGTYDGLDTSVDAPYVLLTPTSVPRALPFNDASTPNVINDVTAAIYAEAIGAADTDTYFALSELLPYGVALGQANRPGWATLALSSISSEGAVDGSLLYKKDAIANTLLINGSAVVTLPYNLAALPAPTTVNIGVFPAGFIPNYNWSFILQARALDSGANWLKDSTSTQYITDVQGYIGNAGGIVLYPLKPVAGCTVYVIEISLVVPLD